MNQGILEDRPQQLNKIEARKKSPTGLFCLEFSIFNLLT